ncbi:MAG: pyridoxamine 5'-phosphate oxidase family protein [Bacteroidota bacterium]
MAKQLSRLNSALQTFIEQQKIFFVSTAMREGRINLSPKGMDTLRVIDSNKVVWLNLTGSGNETAAHLLESNRMTMMFCAFEGNPLILRLYGQAKVYHERDEAYQQYIELFPALSGVRQAIELNIDLVQTSCGYAVPLMDYREERTRLTKWADDKGEEGIKKYWEEKNTLSLDGHPTGIFE